MSNWLGLPNDGSDACDRDPCWDNPAADDCHVEAVEEDAIDDPVVVSYVDMARTVGTCIILLKLHNRMTDSGT
jgi:hypothetical protein